MKECNTFPAHGGFLCVMNRFATSEYQRAALLIAGLIVAVTCYLMGFLY